VAHSRFLHSFSHDFRWKTEERNVVFAKMSVDSLNETKRLLFQSCKDGCTSTVQHLLTRHADLRAQINSLTDDDGNTALIIASKTRHTGIVKLLLECGAKVDHKNSRGWTALMKASENGDSKLEVIELLLKYGAQVDLQNDAGESALMVAAQNGQAKLATKLVREYKANVHLKQKHSSWTALMEASENGSINIVKLLLEHGADDLGWALVLAILNKHNDIIELLLEHGAQVDDKNWSLFLDQPPLVVVVEKGDADIVKLLLEHGAKEGIDSAMTYAINEHAEIAKILSGHGAQVDEDWVDLPPLIKAAEKGDADIVQFLLKHGAKKGIDQAITTAILGKHAEIVKILSERGAQVDEDMADFAPLLVEAIENEDADVVKMLLEHGANKGLECMGHVRGNLE
jgi:ankyrin repeat protein